MAKILIEVTDKASKPLKKIEGAAEDTDEALEDTSSQADDTSESFGRLGIAAAAVGVALAASARGAIEVDRAMFGLDENTRKYIRSASELYGINQTLIAQYTRTFTSAGLAGEEIVSMMDAAVALGRLYPNESTEEFVDNLRQFVTTGEDAGFITDVLESHFRTTKLETIAFADKMKALKEITGGVNTEFGKTKAGRYDKVMTTIENAVDDLGTALLDVAEDSGALWLFIKVLQGGAVAASAFATGVNVLNVALRSIVGTDTTEAVKGLAESIERTNKAMDKFFGRSKEVTLDDIIVPTGGGGGGTEGFDDEGEAAKITQEFWDAYQAATMTATEYQLTKLAEMYTYYDQYVQDKVALEEWFASESKRIIDEQVTDYKEFTEGAIDTMANGMTSMFRDWQQGALDFKDSMKRILQEIAAQMFEILVVKQLIGGFSGMLGFAQGGAFVNGVQKFASGGVVTSPTVFPMATGIGLMGEAGAEAIMPLSRTKSGDLGVQATVPVVNVNVENYGNSEVSVTQDGDDINIILSQIASSIQRGTGDVGNAIQSRYGLQKV